MISKEILNKRKLEDIEISNVKLLMTDSEEKIYIENVNIENNLIRIFANSTISF